MAGEGGHRRRRGVKATWHCPVHPLDLPYCLPFLTESLQHLWAGTPLPSRFTGAGKGLGARWWGLGGPNKCRFAARSLLAQGSPEACWRYFSKFWTSPPLHSLALRSVWTRPSHWGQPQGLGRGCYRNCVTTTWKPSCCSGHYGSECRGECPEAADSADRPSQLWPLSLRKGLGVVRLGGSGPTGECSERRRLCRWYGSWWTGLGVRVFSRAWRLLVPEPPLPLGGWNVSRLGVQVRGS